MNIPRFTFNGNTQSRHKFPVRPFEMPTSFASHGGDKGLQQSPTRCIQGQRMKRKCSSYDGIPVPSHKQLITEEKMAACMQRLSLRQTSVNLDGACSSKSRSDDSDFEDCDEIQDFDLSGDKNEKFFNQKPRLPVIEFAPGMKESFQNLNPILPESILEKIINKPCLALVPYIPPADYSLKLITGLTDGQLETKDDDSSNTQDVPQAMNIEPFSLEWDSDCEDDFLLD